MLIWEQKFATGVEEIDAQHRALFHKINELLDAAGSGLPRDRVDRIVSSLHEHAVEHFACEEGHMESRRCSGCAVNRLAHREFLRDFSDLREQFEREGATPRFVDQVRERVGAWLTTHIMVMDLALREAGDREVTPEEYASDAEPRAT